MTDCICANCGVHFRRYRISATRAAKPQYCSQSCFSEVMRKRSKQNIEKRFYDRVNVLSENECWEWAGRRDLNGYGRLDINGKPRLAHRVAFVLANGFECENVCHSCDNPPCCNPAHLWAGNPKLNVADMMHKGRHAGVPRSVGSNNPASRLSEAQVMEILKSSESNKQLGVKFGVSAAAIRLIRIGKNWSYLQVM